MAPTTCATIYATGDHLLPPNFLPICRRPEIIDRLFIEFFFYFFLKIQSERFSTDNIIDLLNDVNFLYDLFFHVTGMTLRSERRPWPPLHDSLRLTARKFYLRI